MLHDQSGNPVPLAIPTVHTEPATPPAKDKGKG
jgi:hypothetical protein